MLIGCVTLIATSVPSAFRVARNTCVNDGHGHRHSHRYRHVSVIGIGMCERWGMCKGRCACVRGDREGVLERMH